MDCRNQIAMIGDVQLPNESLYKKGHKILGRKSADSSYRINPPEPIAGHQEGVMNEMDPKSFYRLMRKARAGNAKAHEIFWRELYFHPPNWMKAALYKRGVSEQDLEDAVHDLFVRLMETLPTLRRPEAFPAFAYRILQTVARGYRPRASFVELPDTLAANADDGGSEAERTVNHALSKLPKALADAIRTARLNDFSRREAAEILGSSERQVKRRVTEGMARMRAMMLPSVTATIFVDSPTSGHRFLPRELPADEYRVGVFLQNSGGSDVALAGSLHLGAVRFAAAPLVLARHSTAAPILADHWKPTIGRHYAQFDLQVDGCGIAQKFKSPVRIVPAIGARRPMVS